MRKIPIVGEHYYHIFNRSISQYRIFNDTGDYTRMLDIISLFRFKNFKQSFSHFIELTIDSQLKIKNDLEKSSQKLVEIVAYCLMPTHFHLILKQIMDGGIVNFISRISNSHTRYFNTLHGRKGPLWEGHFSNVLIDTDELILHITRYLHLNAVTAKIVDRPEDWLYSSYNEYIARPNTKGICNFRDVIDITPLKYKKFINDQIGYQRELSKIKHLLIDNHSR